MADSLVHQGGGIMILFCLHDIPIFRTLTVLIVYLRTGGKNYKIMALIIATIIDN